MNPIEEISKRAPTRLTRLSLALLVFFEGLVFALVPFLNPITLELDEKNLTWLRIVLALSLALIASMVINTHLTIRLKKISKWVNERDWVRGEP